MPYPLTYLYLTVFVTMVVATTLLASAFPAQPVKRDLVVAAVLVTLWTLGDLLSNLATSAWQVELLSKIFCPTWALLPVVAVRVAATYSSGGQRSRSPLHLLLLSLPALGVMAVDWGGLLYDWYLPASAETWYFRVGPTRLQWFVDLYFVLYIGTGGWIFFRAARRAGPTSSRSTARLFLYGLLPVVFMGCVVNGGLLPLPHGAPLVSATLVACFCAYAVFGTLHSEYFVPVQEFRRERDLARDVLSKREEVLASIPLGVAIAARETGRVLYTNLPFRQLTGTVEGGALPSAIAEELQCDDEIEARDVALGASEGDVALLRAVRVSYSGTAAELITLRDVTSQRRTERELHHAEEQLQQSQKLESIGRLAAGIAHDFNNQLTSIINYTQFVGDALPAGDERQGDLEEVLRAARRAQALTQQLLAFGRKQAVRPESLDLNAVLRGIEGMLSRTLGADVRLTLNLAPGPIWLCCDRVQLEQVLINLAANARDAMPGGGSLEFRVSAPERDTAPIVLQVIDTGCGMPSEVAERVFEPFFSTKGEHGVGLGLATVYGMVVQAGGCISVSSQVGQGTCFTIELPAGAAPVPGPEVAPPAPPKPTATTTAVHRTILLVDDEEPLRRSVCRLLKQASYVVVEAADGARALELFRSRPRDIDLLITDLTMPGMNGHELATQLKGVRPELPVIYISGHIERFQRELGDDAIVLQKPFERELLLARIAAALTGAPLVA